jgi:sugar phosphate isomerase/epimerase
LPKVKAFGYDGVELACWGDHFEVSKADDAYCAKLRALLEKTVSFAAQFPRIS